jgi:iron complex transport system substrate-binding protein
VPAVSPRAESPYVATPAGTPELSDFLAWGLHIVVPETIDFRGYFETLSWENVDKYQTDLIIIDDRSPANRQTAEAQPTWTSLKAAAASAVTDWPAYWLRNYGAYARELDRLTSTINAADENLTD